MTVSNNGLEFLKQKEALRLTAYNLGDGWTIGYGNKFYENGGPVKQFDTITRARAESLFNNIVKNFASEVNKLVFSKVRQSQFDALVSYAYNRGIGKFRSSNLLKMVNQNPQNEAIRQQFVIEWGTNQTFKNALIERRKKEADLYFSDSNFIGQTNIDLIQIIFLILIFIIFKKYFYGKQE
jgi:lysozyme